MKSSARHTNCRHKEEPVGPDFNFWPRKCHQFDICKTSSTTKTSTQAVSVCSWPSKSTTTSTSSTTDDEVDADEKSSEEIEFERRRRKRDREAARVAVSGIKRSAYFDINVDAEKELVSLCSCSSYYVLRGNPLRRLGLFLKGEYNDDDDDHHHHHVRCCRKKRPCMDMGGFGYKVDNINGNIDEATSALSCGYAMTSSPRKKDDDRVEMLKLRYKDTILKAQRELGIISDDHHHNKQDKFTRRRSLKTTTSSSGTGHHCKTKAATINAPSRGPTLA